jgi:hypothetical protein
MLRRGYEQLHPHPHPQRGMVDREIRWTILQACDLPQAPGAPTTVNTLRGISPAAPFCSSYSSSRILALQGERFPARGWRIDYQGTVLLPYREREHTLSHDHEKDHKHQFCLFAFDCRAPALEWHPSCSALAQVLRKPSQRNPSQVFVPLIHKIMGNGDNPLKHK